MDTLERFGATLRRDEFDVDALSSELASATDETMLPICAIVWLRGRTRSA